MIQDLRYALRRLARFTLAALATIALAVGANTAIFSMVDGVVLRPLPVRDPDRLVRLREANPALNLPGFSVSRPNWDDWRRQSRSFEGMAAFRRMRRNLLGGAQPETVRTMEQILFGTAAQPRFSALLLGLLAVASLVLAAVGLYGLLSPWVGERTREFGVRLAVGARPADLLALVLGHGLGLGLIGLALGLPVAWALSRVLGGLLYGVAHTDPATYLGVCALLAATAALACYLPARRASRVDPMVALRYE